MKEKNHSIDYFLFKKIVVETDAANELAFFQPLIATEESQVTSCHLVVAVFVVIVIVVVDRFFECFSLRNFVILVPAARYRRGTDFINSIH